MRNLATISPLKSKLSGKFQRFNAIDGSIEMLKKIKFPRISIKIKDCEIIYEAQTNCLREIIQPPPTYSPPDKILLRPCNKNFLTEICRNIQTFAFKVLKECSSWASRNGAVQMLFLTPNRNMFAEKFVKLEKFLVVLWEHIIFNVRLTEVRKMSEVF